MDWQQITEDALRLYSEVLEEAGKLEPETDLRAGFIYRHALNILKLAEDAYALENMGRTHSVAVLIRSMLDSQFSLVAARNNPEFAASKVIAEAELEASKLEHWATILPHEDDVWLKITREGYRETASRLRLKHGIAEKKEWKPWQCAKEAKLEHEYVRDYFIFSNHTHSSFSSMIEIESDLGKGKRIETMIRILCTAIAATASVLKTSGGVGNIDKATALVARLGNLKQDGVFTRMNLNQ